MHRTLSRSLSGLFALSVWTVSLCSSALAENVVIVDAGGLQSYPGLQSAIDAASNGDVLVVAPGVYAPFTIDDKTVWIEAATPGTVQVDGTVTIQNLKKAKYVVLSGLSITGLEQSTFPGESDPALVLTDDRGNIRVQDCTITGGRGGDGCHPYGSGGDAVIATNCKRLAFVRSTLTGGDGRGNSSGDYSCTGGDGGHGIVSTDTQGILYDCEVRGGIGATAGCRGGEGGTGAVVLGVLGLAASNTSFIGADGGDAWDFLCENGGDGGDGVFVGATPQIQAVGCTFDFGEGGYSGTSPTLDGEDGVPVAGTGNVNQHPGVAPRTFTTAPIQGDGAGWTVDVTGLPGDRVFLLRALRPHFKVLPHPTTGIFLVPAFPPLVAWEPGQVIGASGALTIQTGFAPLPAGQSHAKVFLQGYVLGQQGSSQLGSPMNVLVLNGDGQPDCDADAVNDLSAVLDGAVADVDQNLVPDGCDPDCNNNLVVDGLDISSGTSLDCDLNGVPDECDVAGGSDCNFNGVPDSCDIDSGASSDANGSGVPDECEPNNTWHVDASAVAGGAGGAGDPFQTIGEGIQASITGDVVVVHDGTYVGSSNRDLDPGGRDIVIRSLNGPATCIIDCQSTGRGFQILSGETEAAVIDGFTVRNGTANFESSGINIVDSSPTIRNCVLESNQSASGGGLWALRSRSRIENCTFIGNVAPGGGGGLYSRFSTLTVESCHIEGNDGALFGGGIAVVGEHSTGGELEVRHTKLIDNTSIWAGVYVANADIAFDDCLIAGNCAEEGGGGLRLYSSGSHVVDVTGCTIAGNYTDEDAGGIAAIRGVTVRMRNSISWGNVALGASQELALLDDSGVGPTVDVAFCDVAGGQAGVAVSTNGTLAWGAGNLDADPLFVDRLGADLDATTAADGDYRLAAGSPCIDAGDVGEIPPDVLDIDDDGDLLEAVPLDLGGLPRRFDDPAVADTGAGAAPVVDLGSYEKQP